MSIGWRWAGGGGEGRAGLTEPLVPHKSYRFETVVRVPDAGGDHLLEVNLVQDRVAWFENPTLVRVSVLT